MLKILFVAGGNKSERPGAVVQHQADSIQKLGHTIDFFLVRGKGAKGYLQNRSRLNRTIRNGDYDVVHAHGFSSFLAGLTWNRPVVASLLGSEVMENPKLHWLFRFFIKYRWQATIVKSQLMADTLYPNKNHPLHLIPNGVNLSFFKPIPKKKALDQIGSFPSDKINILFLADPGRKSKNAELAKEAVLKLSGMDVNLHIIHGIDSKLVPYYLNAADVVLLTSRWEGSPNVVKEAMACNRPVIATNVGDVRWLFGDEKGYYIADPNPDSVVENIKKAIEFGGATRGRERIKKLGIDSETAAKKIITIYERVLDG